MKGRIRNLLFALVCLISGFGVTAYGQVSPGEHASHHPGQAEPPAADPQSPRANAPPAAPPTAGAGGMMGGAGASGMGKMMEQMGAPKAKELYPSLMDLPDLPLQKRAEIQQKAHERMKAGVAVLSEGLQELSAAAPTDDFTAMQVATERMRVGLGQFESGLAAHRALAEGKAPRNVAIQWFKREMNLLPPASAAIAGPLGLPARWFHLFVIAILTAFTGGMFWMYFQKMRRATLLLARLPAGTSTGNTSTEVVAPAPEPPAPAAPPPVSVAAGVRTDAVPAAAPPVAPKSSKWSGSLSVALIFAETPDVKTFRLINPEGGELPFTYKPGQYLTLTVEPDGKPVKRSYTIASSPTQANYIEITVKREEHGVVSRYLHERLKPGDELPIAAPSGYFTFSGSESDSIVLVAGGVGITPMMSAIRYLTDRAWQGDIFLLFCARTSNDFIFREELEYLQRRHSNLHVIATMTRSEGTVWMGLKGRLTTEFLRMAVPDIVSRRVHICGPPGMMDGVKQMLGEIGVPKEQVKTEAFGTAKRTPKPKADSPPPPTGATAPAAAQVSFSVSGKTGRLTPDLTVLDVADEAGVEIDNSCRSGTCGSCKVKLLSGTVTMECEDALEPEDKATNMILACQAKSDADLSVEA